MSVAMFVAEPRTCFDGPAPPEAEAVVTLDEFVDFCLSAGLDRLRFARPAGKTAYDFYDGLRPVLRDAHEVGDFARLDSPGWSADRRRDPVYRTLARSYATAALRYGVTFQRAEDTTLRLGALDVRLEPHGLWLREGKRTITVFLHFPGEAASRKRAALYLLAARVADVVGGFVDLQHGADLLTDVGGLTSERALRYFEAEAHAFLAMRRSV